MHTCIQGFTYTGHLSSFQVIISSTHTTGTVTGLTPFTIYICSIVIYTSSVTSGIVSHQITVRTGEAGMYI